MYWAPQLLFVGLSILFIFFPSKLTTSDACAFIINATGTLIITATQSSVNFEKIKTSFVCCVRLKIHFYLKASP